MHHLILSFVASLLVGLFLVRFSHRLLVSAADSDLSGKQKFHVRPVPRIGGVAILLGLLTGVALSDSAADPATTLQWLLLACAMPAFIAGLSEDLTKKVSPRRRLFFTAVSASLGIWLLDGLITRTDLPGLQWLVGFTPFAIALTLFMVTGVANAINIIDGFNGLASMCMVMMFGALAYVAFQVGDAFIVTAALITIGSILGFFVWNFPAGLIFLGDGGAYLLGFLFGELGVLLVARNEAVSPWFPVMLCAYPIVETVFSIYRKKCLRGMSPGIPDGVHLHMLIYKRLMRWTLGTSPRQKTARNSMTSPYLWLLCLLSVIPALLYWDSTPFLLGFSGLFVVTYVLLYWRIVRFRTPRWLVVRR